MIPLQGKRIYTTQIDEPTKREHTFLSCNESNVYSPSLEFLDTSTETVTEDEMLQYLADILCDIYIAQIYDATKKGSSVL